jgi:hypothetical protein
MRTLATGSLTTSQSDIETGACEIDYQDYRGVVTGNYNSSEFNKVFKRIPLTVQSAPDVIGVDITNGMHCWPQSSPESDNCGDYTKSFNLPLTTSNGHAISRFYMSISPDCRNGGVLSVSWTTASGTSGDSALCETVVASLVLGVIASEPILSFTLRSDVYDYALYYIYVFATSCATEAPTTAFPTAAPTPAATLPPTAAPTSAPTSVPTPMPAIVVGSTPTMPPTLVLTTAPPTKKPRRRRYRSWIRRMMMMMMNGDMSQRNRGRRARQQYAEKAPHSV